MADIILIYNIICLFVHLLNIPVGRQHLIALRDDRITTTLEVVALQIAALQIDVRCQHILATGEGPAVQVVNVVDFGNLHNLRFNLFSIDVFWRLLHEYRVAVFCNLYGGREDNDGENEREDGIEDLE